MFNVKEQSIFLYTNLAIILSAFRMKTSSVPKLFIYLFITIDLRVKSIFKISIKSISFEMFFHFGL